MDPKATVGPCIEVEKHALTGRELGRSEDDTAVAFDLSAFFLEDDSSSADFALESFLHPDRNVGKDPIFVGVAATRKRKDPANDDCPGAYYKIIVGRG
jgi:hypothetical protein